MGLKLRNFPGMAIAVKTLEQYNTLMALYDSSGWKSYSGNSLREIDGFRLYGSDSVVCASDNFEINSRREKDWLRTLGLNKIISLEEFLRVNGCVKKDD